ELRGVVQTLFDTMLPRGKHETSATESLAHLLEQHGFDRLQHEQIRSDLKEGRIGLAQNRLPASAVIEDAREGDVTVISEESRGELKELGVQALRAGQVALVTLAAGAGSRWTQGAGVVKALHPFCKLAGGHRTFIEIHLAKSRRTSKISGIPVQHVITTSYLTHAPTEAWLRREHNYDYSGPLYF